jgi:hypothetical protein
MANRSVATLLAVTRTRATTSTWIYMCLGRAPGNWEAVNAARRAEVAGVFRPAVIQNAVGCPRVITQRQRGASLDAGPAST